jgi:hypothetical protein
MEMVLPRISTPETRRQNSEILNEDYVVYLGRLAISKYLGINDPRTHLVKYLKEGESAKISIEQDIETDIAERLPKTPFVNYVNFEFTGSDFVSAKDKVSMNSMIKNNLKILAEGLITNPDLKDEYDRAKIEAQEVDKLTDWFETAPIGSHLVFESLPIENQEFAISRIYQKKTSRTLEGCFVSLYNPSINLFNELRDILDTNALTTCKTKNEVLQNNYEFNSPNRLKTAGFSSFTDYYVEIYDQLLESHDEKQHSFGLEKDKKAEMQNGIQKVRNQPNLTSTYLEVIKTIARSDGLATSELIEINDLLNTGYKLKNKQALSNKIIHDIMSKTILGIAKAIDENDINFLNNLKKTNVDSGANFAAISYYSRQAQTAGETYSSNGCFEYIRDSTNQEASYENNALERAFWMGQELPDEFGKPKIGVCRIANCPSHGDGWILPNKTLVGGCDICLCCHKMIVHGESPEKIYAEEKLKKEQKIEKDKATKAKMATLSIDRNLKRSSDQKKITSTEEKLQKEQKIKKDKVIEAKMANLSINRNLKKVNKSKDSLIQVAIWYNPSAHVKI